MYFEFFCIFNNKEKIEAIGLKDNIKTELAILYYCTCYILSISKKIIFLHGQYFKMPTQLQIFIKLNKSSN